MIYDGYDFSNLLKVESVHRSILPSVSVETATIPGRDGSVFRSVSLGELTIDVDVRLIARVEGLDSQKRAFEALRRKVAGLLLRTAPCQLVVDDAPDLTYTAMLEGGTDLDRFVYSGGTTLSFKCMDPWGVGRTVRRSAQPTASEEGNDVSPAVMTANVGGNYPTAPVLTFPGDSTMVQATFDGAVFSAYGRAGAGDMVVDAAAKKAYQGEHPATIDINCDWPVWEPGLHTVSSNDAFTVEWSERWV